MCCLVWPQKYMLQADVTAMTERCQTLQQDKAAAASLQERLQQEVGVPLSIADWFRFPSTVWEPDWH